MALLNLFVLLVDSLIELICMYLCIELTLLLFFFSFGCFNVFFPPAWTYKILFASPLFKFSVDLFLICLHPFLGFCFAKCRDFVGHCEFCPISKRD